MLCVKVKLIKIKVIRFKVYDWETVCKKGSNYVKEDAINVILNIQKNFNT